MTATTGGPPPHPEGNPTGHRDRYVGAVDELAERAIRFYGCLYGAREAIGSHRHILLAELHCQIRIMAMVLTTALGELRPSTADGLGFDPLVDPDGGQTP
jgi:hypothetical protein